MLKSSLSSIILMINVSIYGRLLEDMQTQEKLIYTCQCASISSYSPPSYVGDDYNITANQVHIHHRLANGIQTTLYGMEQVVTPLLVAVATDVSRGSDRSYQK